MNGLNPSLNVREELIRIHVWDTTTHFTTKTPSRSKITWNRLISIGSDLGTSNWKWIPEVKGTSSNIVLGGEEMSFISPHKVIRIWNRQQDETKCNTIFKTIILMNKFKTRVQRWYQWLRENYSPSHPLFKWIMADQMNHNPSPYVFQHHLYFHE